MNAKSDESASSRAGSDDHDDRRPGSAAVRTVRYPSMDFPVPPAIELVVPETWRPVGAVALNEMRTRPDIAVAGPDVVHGVRPNLMAKVSRVPVDGDATAAVPSDLLEALFARQRTEDGAVGFEHRIHDTGSNVPPYGVSRYTERLVDVEVLRLTCAVIVATGPIVHLVVVQAALSPTDHLGLSAIEAAFASLRVSAPIPAPIGAEGDRG